MKLKQAIAGTVAITLLAGGAWWWWQRGDAQTPEYRTAKIERGSLQATVAASGAVNPVALVTVGTQVSGQIRDLLVDFNSEVKAGQLLAQIDPETFEYRVRSSQADVDAARAAVMTAQANQLAAVTQVSRAQVDLTEAQRDLDRKQSLVEKGFIAQSEADKARALVNTNQEALKAVQAQVVVAQANVKLAQANVAQRDSALAQARIDLQRTRITSPVNGIVVKRAIERGQTVAASLQAPELFIIAQNLRDMQVEAAIDESDVGRLRTGQKATFSVDAFPGQTFEGEIKQVRKAATNVANVVTYVAVVAFSNADGKLLPGMTANVRVVTDQRESVLKVPNAALRMRIAGVEPAETAKPAGAASAPVPSSSGGSVGWNWLPQAIAQSNGGSGGGGALASMRERLTSELQLTPEQQSKLESISAAMRPQFQGLRDLPEDQRSAAREKLMVELRKNIGAMLTPEQRTRYETLQAHSPVASGPAAQTPSGAASVGRDAKADPKSDQPASAAPVSPAPAVAPPAANGGPGTEFRNRVVTELQLNAQQIAKVDDIYAEARPKFMALRDLAPEERGKARERISSDIRARIGDLLTPPQKAKFSILVAEAASRTSTRGRIYVLDEQGKPKAFNVRLGITDGSSTELIVNSASPDAVYLKEGAEIITGIQSSGAAKPAPGKPATSPRLGF